MARVAGLFLFLAGWGLRRWALRELARVGIKTRVQLAVAAVPEEYTAEGPYRWLRHPCYLGSYMVFAGVGMMAFGMWAGAALYLPSCPHYYRRSLLEEERRAIQEIAR